jgi:hypothetical protein
MSAPGLPPGLLPVNYSVAMARAEVVSTSPAYWFDAQRGVAASGTDVTTWTDVMAGAILSFVTGTNPTYITKDAAFGGSAVVSFSGAGNVQGTLTSHTPDSTLLLVCIPDETRAGIYMTHVGIATTNLVQWGGAPDLWGMYNSGAIVGTAATALSHTVPNTCMALITSGFSCDLRNLGVQETPAFQGNGFQTLGLGDIGGIQGQYFHGRVSAMLYWNSVINATQLSKVSRGVLRLYRGVV